MCTRSGAWSRISSSASSVRVAAMRFEKLSRNYLAFVHLAAVLVWLL
jgi:superfamily I DNA and RNA helicase